MGASPSSASNDDDDSTLEGKHVSSNADRHNPNNDSFWQRNDYERRPDDVGKVYNDHSDRNNPNNSDYGRTAEDPNEYLDNDYPSVRK